MTAVGAAWGHAAFYEERCQPLKRFFVSSPSLKPSARMNQLSFSVLFRGRSTFYPFQGVLIPENKILHAIDSES